MFAASKSGAVQSAPKDAQFNYVTMLLHGDGTNGAQNNTFLDSSSNAFTITRNGNTTQGSFSPYGSNWSNYFDGSSYLSVASASALNIGSSDMTMEFWLYMPSAFASDYRVVFAKGNNVAGGNSYAIEGMASGALVLYVNTDGSSGWNLINGTSIGTPTVGAWNHVVVCRSGTAWYSFMNGTRVLNTTGSGTVTASSTAVTIGDYGAAGYKYTGYISNLRLVNGTAVYSNASTCTVPTAPLTAVTNTALLTCQSNRFIDNSSNAFTVSVAAGTPSVQRFNPFGASTAYSTATIGGSGYFDGTGDYLTSPDNTAVELGSGNFTIEAWIYPKDNAWQTIATKSGSAQTSEFQFYAYSNAVNFFASAGSSWNIGFYTGAVLVPNSWNHVAVTRSGTSWTIWVNGVSSATTTGSVTINNNTDALHIGAFPDGFNMTGYMCDFRLVKGTAVYTTAFTPPTAPLTAVSGTSVLLNYQNGAIYDNAMMNDLETVGNAQISTSVKKYGTGSLYFDGTGDSITAPSSVNANFGTGDFTIEMWANATTIPSYPSAGFLIDARTNANWYIFFASNSLYFGDSASTEHSGGTVSTGSWYHIAICRSSGTTKGFVNGVQAFSFADSGSYVGAPILTIGARYTNTYNYTGYIDDLRITKGYARYTTTFTPPTAAFPNTGPN